MRRGEPHAERNALDACSEPVVGRDGLRLARALQPPRPPAAVRRRADGGRHRARRLRDRRPEPRGRRARPRAPARRGRRGRARRRPPRGARAAAERRLPHARRARPAVRAAQARRVARRPHRHEHGGEPLDLLAARAAALVHDWRAEFDAVAVGSGTALADDPELLPRDAVPPAERLPLRVVFDRRGRLRAGAAAWRAAPRRRAVLRVAPPGAPPPPAGVEALDGRTRSQRRCALLGEREVTSLLVEGGAELAGALAARRPRRRARALPRARADRRRRARRCSGRSA